MESPRFSPLCLPTQAVSLLPIPMPLPLRRLRQLRLLQLRLLPVQAREAAVVVDGAAVIQRSFRKSARCCRTRPRSRSNGFLKTKGPRSQQGPLFLGCKRAESNQMTLSLLLSILLMPGFAQAKDGAVAGTLRGTDGKPAAGVRVGVMLVPEVGRGVRGAGTLVSQAETDDAGKFQLEEVPPGRYYIVAGNLKAPTFYPGVLKIDAAKTIEVRAMATVRDIDFEVAPSTASVAAPAPYPVVSVTGRIVLKNSPNAPMPPIITLQGDRMPTRPATLPPQFQPPLVAIGMSMTVAVAPEGLFNVTLPIGDHRFSDVSLPEGYSLASITSGGRNVLNQTIDVKAGVGFVVTIDVGDIRPRYRLMALVREDNTDQPLPGRVELVQSSGEVLRLTVNAQGVVTFPRLLPGTYVVRLVSAGFDVPEKQVVITDSSVQVELRARKKPE